MNKKNIEESLQRLNSYRMLLRGIKKKSFEEKQNVGKEKKER